MIQAPAVTGTLVEALGLSLTYAAEGGGEVTALQRLDFRLGTGQTVAVIGANGSGKSSLVNLLAGAVRPTAGELRVAGHDLVRMGARERQEYRLRVVGWQRQSPGAGLWPDLTALQNLEVPLLAASSSPTARAMHAAELLQAFTLEDAAARPAGGLSADQRVRLALACALVNRPALLVADEPMAGLDEPTSVRLMRDLADVLRRLPAAAVITSVDTGLPGPVDGTLHLRRGV